MAKYLHLQLRLPMSKSGLHQALKAKAKMNKRSLNSQIIEMLSSERPHPLETAVVQAMRELQGYDLAQRRMVEAIERLRADIVKLRFAKTQPPNGSLQDWGKEWAAFNSWRPGRADV